MSASPPTATRRAPRAVGTRTARAAQRRRRRRVRRLVVVLAALAIVAVSATITLLATGELSPPDAPDAEDATAAPPRATEQSTLLVVRRGPGAEAAGVTLVATSPGDDRAVVLFIPAGTLVDIPGHQLDRLATALAYGSGDPQLVRRAVESALGIVVDHTAVVTTAGLAAFLGRTGGLEVDVGERVVLRTTDGSADVRFEAGTQELDGARLAELWSLRPDMGDELATFPRQQQVWAALAGALADDPELAATLADGGAPPLGTSADADWLAAFWEDLGAAAAVGGLRFQLLPVELVSGEAPDGSSAYRLSRDAAAALVSDSLAGAVPEGGGQEAMRVEILNGVGVPGLGAEVDALLDSGRFRLVRSDNARSFDFARTLILVYDETRASVAAAEAVQASLGVGTIQVSRQPQSVVDLTIVVGADFVDVDEVGDDAEAPDADQG